MPKQHTTIRSWPAICLGIFFAAVTGYVLFADVLTGAAITTTHVLALAAIVAAIASGHMAWPQLKAGAIVPALLLAVLFAGSTAYVVVSSGARNAETAENKAARIEATNSARARELRDLALAEDMHKAVSRKLGAECVNGRASKAACDGYRATEAVYSAAIRGHKATLKDLGPELAPNGGYAHAAKVIAALPGVTASAADIEDRLALLLPFVVVLIAELGTIAFLHIGLGHAAPAAAGKPAANENAPAPNGPARAPAKRGDNVVNWVREFRRVHGRDPQIPELQQQFPGTPKTTAWRRCRAA